MSFEEVQQRYDACGQGHIFEYWPELSAVDQNILLSQAAQIPVEQVTKVFAASMADFEAANNATSESHDIAPLNDQFIISDPSPEELASWRSEGLRLIAANKVGAVVLAGGQGTRLGSPLPKGMLNLGLPSGKEIFELMAQRILRVQQLAEEVHGMAGKVQWFIMTSDATHDVIVDYFQRKNYLGLDANDIHFFKQGFLPAFTLEGKIVLQTKGSLCLSPDGNGGIYRALKTHGILDDMLTCGLEYIQAYNVDNVLIKVADPVFFGFCAHHKVDCAAKTVAKTGPDEKVGVFAVKEGRHGVIEYSEIGAMRANAHKPDGTLMYNDANISIYTYSVGFLKLLVEHHLDSLPYHVAKKEIPSVDGKVPGVKLEAFIFDVFQFASRFYLLQVRRNEEFSGVKNAEGSGQADTPETARNDIYNLHRHWIETAGGTIKGHGEVEVSPLVSYAGEGLEAKCAGQTFEVPVHIVADVEVA